MGNTNIRTNRTEGAEGPVHTRQRREWTKELNKLLMECYLSSEPTKRGFRKRMLNVWNERGLFIATEQQLAGQVRCIKNKEWLSAVEIEEIQRAIDREHEDGGRLFEVEEVEPNENAQHQETEVQQEDVIESQGVDEIEEELGLNEEERYILEMLKKKLEMPEKLEPVNLRYEDKKKVRENKKNLNDVLDKIKTENLNGSNLLVLAAANVVADLVGRKEKRAGKKQEPFWKRRMKKQIKDIESNITRLEQWRANKLESTYWKKRFEEKYFVKNKGISTVIEELKQRVKVIRAKVRKYD